MTYSFECENCGREFTLSLSVMDMDQPLSEPCPSCRKFGEIHRIWNWSGPIKAGKGGVDSIHSLANKKAGSDWGDLMKTIKKGSAKCNTINI